MDEQKDWDQTLEGIFSDFSYNRKLDHQRNYDSRFALANRFQEIDAMFDSAFAFFKMRKLTVIEFSTEKDDVNNSCDNVLDKYFFDSQAYQEYLNKVTMGYGTNLCDCCGRHLTPLFLSRSISYGLCVECEEDMSEYKILHGETRYEL